MRAARKVTALVTPEALKARLRNERDSGNTRYGGDGECLVAEYLRERGHEVEFVHAGGVDLAVDGSFQLDVKTHLAFGKKATSRLPAIIASVRMIGVLYPRVVFYDDVVRMFDVPCIDDPSIPVDLSWEAACELLSRATKRARIPLADPQGVRAAQRAVCDELRAWIASQWGVAAHVVFRGNPIAQDNMGKRGWGPESFYQDPEKVRDKFQLVVLVYFEGPAPRTVMAYPLSHIDEITWGKKPVGPNLTKRKTFNPRTLDSKFIFAGIPQFQQTFLQRFLCAS